MFGRRLITKKEETTMNRRKFLLSSTVAPQLPLPFPLWQARLNASPQNSVRLTR